MADNKTSHTDEGLQDNEQIEQAILALQQQPSQEMLAHALTVLRRRMLAHGQLIVAVEPPVGDNQMRLQAIQTDDGKKWWTAFTSFDEEIKGGGSVMSTFLTDIEKLFTSALSVEEIDGVIINPWNRTLMLDKNLSKDTLNIKVRYLNEQAYAMSVYITLYQKRLKEASNKNKPLVTQFFKQATIDHKAFKDADTEFTLAYYNTPDVPTPFCLDCDWVSTLAFIRSIDWSKL